MFRFVKTAFFLQFLFLLATFNKQLIKPKRAETSGYDGYDED